jgi:hypothetical protein
MFWVQRFQVQGFSVLGSAFWVQRSGFSVLGSRFKGSRVQGFSVLSSAFRVQRSGFTVQGSPFRVHFGVRTLLKCQQGFNETTNSGADAPSMIIPILKSPYSHRLSQPHKSATPFNPGPYNFSTIEPLNL